MFSARHGRSSTTDFYQRTIGLTSAWQSFYQHLKSALSLSFCTSYGKLMSKDYEGVRDRSILRHTNILARLTRNCSIIRQINIPSRDLRDVLLLTGQGDYEDVLADGKVRTDAQTSIDSLASESSITTYCRWTLAARGSDINALHCTDNYQPRMRLVMRSVVSVCLSVVLCL